jgi:hypothetical protein
MKYPTTKKNDQNPGASRSAAMWCMIFKTQFLACICVSDRDFPHQNRQLAYHPFLPGWIWLVALDVPKILPVFAKNDPKGLNSFPVG